MTLLIKDGNVITPSQFRDEHKDTSFGPVINYAEWGYEVLWETTAIYDSMTEYPSQLPPAKDEKGLWRQQWEVLPLSPEDVAARLAAKAEQDNRATEEALAMVDLKSIRSLREYVASKQDAPQFIKDHETTAATLRSKLTPVNLKG